MLKLHFRQYSIVLEDEPNYSTNSTDNPRSYNKQYLLTGEDEYQFSSKHGLFVFNNEELVDSCVMLACGGASGIHANSAFIHQELCFVAVGPMVCCLELPSLDLVWVTRVDSATCFGVYDSIKHSCILSHGEFEIARVTYEGKTVWSRGGKDIFFGGFKLAEDFVIATDFNGEDYKIEIATGQGKA